MFSFIKAYRIRLAGRGGVSYSERGRRLVIPGEFLVGDPDYDVVLYCDDRITWSEGIEVTDQEWGVVQERVSKWFNGRVNFSWEG